MPRYPALIALPLLLVWTIAPLSYADARSKAAEYLVQQEIARACEGKPGRIAPSAVIERDLTGDGKADLVLSHEGITCGANGRNGFCGAQVCDFNIYVRRGALLKLEVQMMGSGGNVGRARIPALRWFRHGGAPHSIRWNGRAFR